MPERDHQEVESLIESRRQLSTLLSNLPGMAYRCGLDPTWPFAFASSGCLALTGYCAEALVRADPDFASIIDPDDREMVWDCVRTAVERGQPFTLTYRIITASGNRRWVWEQGRAVRSASGEVVAIEGFITDITERRSVEERLRRANRLYAVLTRINEAIVRIRHPASLLDEACRIAVEEGRFRLAWIGLRDPSRAGSLEVAACFGDPCGLLDEMRVDGEIVAPVEGHLGRALASGARQIVRRLELDGNPEPWREALLANGLHSACSFPLIVSDQVVGTLSLYSDQSLPLDDDEISLLDALSADLSFALERADEETRRRSLQADLARASSIETIGRVAGSLAHDFNNILMVIGACAEGIGRSGDAASAYSRELEQIRQACERGTDLTRRLLAFGRRKPSEHPQRLDLGALVRDARGLLARMVGPDIELIVEIADGDHPVLSGSEQLEQVLMNLVLNSKDAMPGGGTIRVSVDQVEARHPAGLHGNLAGPYVRLSVQDTGLGFSDEVRERMFEPFFTTKPRETGSGLGLSIAFDVARRSGGWINAGDDLSLGAGARMEVYLPRADV
jgi:PAS domain S-box-containing protein